ncbi:MAG: GIY-YIG nuclease family protein [Nitrospirales bacterium]
MLIKNRPLVSSYGTLWARNIKNISRLRNEGKLFGVYVLCDGSMPVYIGRGKLSSRITRHQRSKSRGQFWDHFSWFAIPDRGLEADVEALLLRMLPFYLRSLNKQRTKFTNSKRMTDNSPDADPIKRPNFAAKRRRR